MPEKIMVVDDEPDVEAMIRQHFRRNIKEGEFEFVFAYNGLEALAKLIEHPDITIILSDLNMPEMDGLTLLAKISELRKPYLTTVIVSAYGDMNNVRAAMNRGAYDFLTKPVNLNDLELTIRKTIDELNKTRSSANEVSRAAAAEQSNSIARGIQQSILPKVFPAFPYKKEFTLYAKLLTAEEVGGDFYDFFLVDKEHVGVVVADVSGKGLNTAIYMATSRIFLKAIAHKGSAPNMCLEQTNNLLYHQADQNRDSLFITAFYGLLNYKTGEFTYSNGGHYSPYLLENDASLSLLENTGDAALGTIRNHVYSNKTVMLKPGDTLFIYTDGLVESTSVDNENYPYPRLEKILSSCSGKLPEEIVHQVLNDLQSFTVGTTIIDDIAVLAVKYLGPPAAEE